MEKAPECSLGPERRGAVAAANLASLAVFTPRSRIAPFVERVVVELRAVALAVVALPDRGVRWLSLRISAISATVRKSLTTERLVQARAALLVSGADEPSD